MKLDRIAIQTIWGLIEADLQLAWDHLQEGQEDFAEHQLRNALEKIQQIRELKSGPTMAGCKVKRVNASNPTIEINDSTKTGAPTS